ncbi:MAG: hypothetical protein ACFBWO_05555 [Paracoccaceae bacterium]
MTPDAIVWIMLPLATALPAGLALGCGAGREMTLVAALCGSLAAALSLS